MPPAAMRLASPYRAIAIVSSGAVSYVAAEGI